MHYNTMASKDMAYNWNGEGSRVGRGHNKEVDGRIYLFSLQLFPNGCHFLFLSFLDSFI